MNHQKRLAATATAGMLALHYRARRTRPGPLPPAPAGSRSVVTDDGTRLYAQAGGDPAAELTVVFVHGLLARTIEFDMQWLALGEQARVIRYDHRNHGRSDRVRRRVSIDQLADDLLNVIDQLAPTGPVVLVGHSLGGMMILALARRRPDLFGDRVVGVGLVATRAGHYLPGHPVENTVRWAARHHLLDLPLLGVRVAAPVLEQLRPRRSRLLRTAIRRFVFGPADADPATIAMLQELLEEPPLSVLAGMGISVLRHDALEGLTPLAKIPVAVIAADGDHLAWPEHARAIAAGIGDNAELVVLPGVGHALNQTRPVEVNAALHRLLGQAARARGTGSSPSIRAERASESRETVEQR